VNEPRNPSQIVVPLFDGQAQHAPLASVIHEAIARVIAAQRFILGEEVSAFEREIADWLGVEHAVGVSSGSDALLVALLALGVGPGDEVITTPYSFFASTGAILRVGARPVFADIDPVSFNVSPAQVARALGPKTRAILPVHLFGRAAEMGELAALAARARVAIVEDAAQAIGARVDDARVGTLGSAGCFSFFPSKNLGAYGDGGLLVSANPALAESARSLRSHGFAPKHHSRLLGGNFRLDALQAAVLRAKLPELSGWNARRQALAERYIELLGPLAERAPERLVLPARAGAQHVFNQFVVRSPERAQLAERLRAAGVETARYYPLPIHLQDVCQSLGYRRGDFPETERACEEALALPIYPGLRSEQLEHVARALAAFLR
jgi:dTDP-4-amino-4,6-dideoxygalactose transaminase